MSLRSLFLLPLTCLVLAAAGIPSEDLAAARSLYEARKLAEAQAAFEKLAATDPKHPEVNHYLGQLANRRDDPDKAVKYFEAAVAAEPNVARHHHGLGDAYGRSAQKAGMLSKFGLAKKCLAAYQRAVELGPDTIEFRQSLFEYYRQAPGMAGGGFDKAAAQAEAIKKLDTLRGRIAFATLYAGEKQYDRAFAEFDEVLKASPDDYAALYQVGRLAAMTGQNVDRGVTSLRRCLELPAPTAPNLPGHAAAQWRLGQLLEKKKDLAGARVAFEAAVKLDPNFTPASEALRKLNAQRNG
ncbi:MAG: tetratricopeptide repeat protein [Verrucomicrobia bacterium]|nr:tetratricopeptide repeat protein [Verrucomicrobiota bacterium]